VGEEGVDEGWAWRMGSLGWDVRAHDEEEQEADDDYDEDDPSHVVIPGGIPADTPVVAVDVAISSHRVRLLLLLL
jgi:N-acyl-L-homoserine lactone synthetase